LRCPEKRRSSARIVVGRMKRKSIQNAEVRREAQRFFGISLSPFLSEPMRFNFTTNPVHISPEGSPVPHQEAIPLTGKTQYSI